MHQKAMELLEESRFKSQNGDSDEVAKLQAEAYRLEREAAEKLLHRYDLEPTRSILFKGAARLALENKLYHDAEQLACRGLSGSPSEYIAEELRQILSAVFKAGAYSARKKSGELVSVIGTLRAAISPNADAGSIKVVDKENKSYTFQIQEGMGDIVRPRYLEEVIASGRRGRRGILQLDSLKSVREEV